MLFLINIIVIIRKGWCLQLIADNDCEKKPVSHYSRFPHFFSVTHLKRQQAAAAATTATKRENKKIRRLNALSYGKKNSWMHTQLIHKWKMVFASTHVHTDSNVKGFYLYTRRLHCHGKNTHTCIHTSNFTFENFYRFPLSLARSLHPWLFQTIYSI